MFIFEVSQLSAAISFWQLSEVGAQPTDIFFWGQTIVT